MDRAERSETLEFHSMDKMNSRSQVTKWLTACCCWLVILNAGGPLQHRAFIKPKEKPIYGLNWTVGLGIQSSTTRLGERTGNILQENQEEKKDLRVKRLTAVVSETHRVPVHLLSANYLPGPRQLYAPGWGVCKEVCHTRAQAVIILFWPLYILWWILSFFFLWLDAFIIYEPLQLLQSPRHRLPEPDANSNHFLFFSSPMWQKETWDAADLHFWKHPPFIHYNI